MDKDMRARIIRRSESGRAGFGFRERMLIQLLICGLILAAVLVASVAGAGVTGDMRLGLKNALAKNFSMGSFLGVFGRGPDAQEEPAAGADGQTPSSQMSGNELDDYINRQNSDARIDEDILDEINNNTDLYIDGN